jgi:hypothetical protein
VSSTVPPTSLLHIPSQSQPFSRPRLERTVWTLQSEPGTLWTASIEMEGGTLAPMREPGNTVLALGSGSASETAKWLDEHRKHREHRAPYNPGLFSGLKGLKRGTLCRGGARRGSATMGIDPLTLYKQSQCALYRLKRAYPRSDGHADSESPRRRPFFLRRPMLGYPQQSCEPAWNVARSSHMSSSQAGRRRLAAGGWRLAAGGWRLAAGSPVGRPAVGSPDGGDSCSAVMSPRFFVRIEQTRRQPAPARVDSVCGAGTTISWVLLETPCLDSLVGYDSSLISACDLATPVRIWVEASIAASRAGFAFLHGCTGARMHWFTGSRVHGFTGAQGRSIRISWTCHLGSAPSYFFSAPLLAHLFSPRPLRESPIGNWTASSACQAGWELRRTKMHVERT